MIKIIKIIMHKNKLKDNDLQALPFLKEKKKRKRLGMEHWKEGAYKISDDAFFQRPISILFSPTYLKHSKNLFLSVLVGLRS